MNFYMHCTCLCWHVKFFGTIQKALNQKLVVQHKFNSTLNWRWFLDAISLYSNTLARFSSQSHRKLLHLLAHYYFNGVCAQRRCQAAEIAVGRPEFARERCRVQGPPRTASSYHSCNYSMAGFHPFQRFDLLRPVYLFPVSQIDRVRILAIIACVV